MITRNQREISGIVLVLLPEPNTLTATNRIDPKHTINPKPVTNLITQASNHDALNPQRGSKGTP